MLHREKSKAKVKTETRSRKVKRKYLTSIFDCRKISVCRRTTITNRLFWSNAESKVLETSHCLKAHVAQTMTTNQAYVRPSVQRQSFPYKNNTQKDTTYSQTKSDRLLINNWRKRRERKKTSIIQSPPMKWRPPIALTLCKCELHCIDQDNR